MHDVRKLGGPVSIIKNAPPLLEVYNLVQQPTGYYGCYVNNYKAQDWVEKAQALFVSIGM